MICNLMHMCYFMTGTPGVGKSTLAEQVAEQTGMEVISVSNLVKDKGLYEEFDDQTQSYVIDEDKVSLPLSK